MHDCVKKARRVHPRRLYQRGFSSRVASYVHMYVHAGHPRAFLYGQPGSRSTGSPKAEYALSNVRSGVASWPCTSLDRIASDRRRSPNVPECERFPDRLRLTYPTHVRRTWRAYPHRPLSSSTGLRGRIERIVRDAERRTLLQKNSITHNRYLIIVSSSILSRRIQSN